MSKEREISLVESIERYGSEEKSRARLEELRWPNGVECLRCDSKNVARMEARHQFQCRSCRYQFSVTAGTIFHDTHLPLWKWLLAIYLIVASKEGISANQLKRTLGVSYKTAWYLCHRIRAALREVEVQLLKGIVEIDETFVGDEMYGESHGYCGNKTIVVGAMQRGGNICLRVVRDTDRETLQGFIRKNTLEDTEAIYTDEWPSPPSTSDDAKHRTIKHGSGEHMAGKGHTNSIENVWDHLKRSIMGNYHQVSVKHLDAYLDELEFKFNNRENPYMFRDALCKLLVSENLPYAKLIQD